MSKGRLGAVEFIGMAVIIVEVLLLIGLHINAHAGTYQELQEKYGTVQVGIAPPETEAESESEVRINKEIPLGSFKLTAYCGCTKCCGKNAKKGPNGEWLAITRSGVRAQKNHTISVDPKVIPLGSKVRIGNIVYTAEDTGGKWVQGKHIDIYLGDHEAAKQFGCQRADVYLVKEE